MVGKRRSPNPPSCGSHPTLSGYDETPIFTAIVQNFKDLPKQANQLLQRLRAIPLNGEIIVNDDSHGLQSGIWLPLLIGPNEFYVSSPNLHEVRAYNRMAQMARGELLVYVQGDACLPATPLWMVDAIRIFGALPNLAMLSARAGFDEVLSYQMTTSYRDARTWGSSPYKALPHSLSLLPYATRGSESKAVRAALQDGSIPFTFASGVDNGPLIYRREAVLSGS